MENYVKYTENRREKKKNNSNQTLKKTSARKTHKFRSVSLFFFVSYKNDSQKAQKKSEQTKEVKEKKSWNEKNCFGDLHPPNPKDMSLKSSNLPKLHGQCTHCYNFQHFLSRYVSVTVQVIHGESPLELLFEFAARRDT